MRVIFLDIDGVLNGYPFLDDIEASSTTESLSRQWWSELIDPNRLAVLNTIIEATGARVVLSTSWRLRWEQEEIASILQEHGFIGEIIGVTMNEPRGKRGAQIARWVEYAPADLESYVCLDDDLDMEPVKARWVQTSPDRGGITAAEADRAIAILETPLAATCA